MYSAMVHKQNIMRLCYNELVFNESNLGELRNIVHPLLRGNHNSICQRLCARII